LVFDYQYDATVRDIDDQFLLGPDLLVAPVITAGSTARQLYLPAGCWYDWYTGQQLAGASFVLTPTPMDRIPLYARGGAVIPMWPEAPPSTAGYHPTVIELHLFVPADDETHRAILQEDDGLTFAALQGARYRTTFDVTRRGSVVTLVAHVEGDGYPEFARTEFHLVIHGGVPSTVLIDGAETAGSGQHFVIPSATFTAEFSV
jgi:alpha-glucosidase